MTDYQKQAQDFLVKTGTTIKKEFDHYGKHFIDDKSERNVWTITISNKYHTYSFKFGDSVTNSSIDWTKYDLPDYQVKILKAKGIKNYDDLLKSKVEVENWYKIMNIAKNHKPVEPDDYSILACLNPLYSTDFEDFCSYYGYDTDSIKAKKVFDACMVEDQNLRKLFDRSELEELVEIC